MKITVEVVFSDSTPYSVANYDLYLNEELQGWLGHFGKLEMSNVKEGENTITIINEKSKKSIRFMASKDVYIWVRIVHLNKLTFSIGSYLKFNTLVKGEDVKILEEKES